MADNAKIAKFTQEQFTDLLLNENAETRVQIMPILDTDDHPYGNYWINFWFFGPNYLEPNMSHQSVHYCLELREVNLNTNEARLQYMGWAMFDTMKYDGLLVKIPGDVFLRFLGITVEHNIELQLHFNQIFGLRGLSLYEKR